APAEPFMVIGNTARMTIEAQVEEIDIAKVSIGQKVKATFDALEGREFYGAVDSISVRAKVDQNGVVTYLVRAVVENNDGAIKDGMTAHVDFILKQAKNVLLVPVKAVTRVNGKPTVIVQRADGAFQTKIIELGLTDGTSVEVKRGLSETDKVVAKKEEKKE
ncbi:MAG: efflux RND transporter periplasmic adaptor subunit, partial [Candidatus Aquicultor sp.]